MEILLPENISEITLDQFLRYEELTKREYDIYTFNKRKIEIFTGIPYRQLDKVKQTDYERIVAQIDKALATEHEFTPIFEMNGIKFGFIPNLDKITMGEYVDLNTHGIDSASLHKLMAVLFRPIVKEQGEKYEITGYIGTEEYADMMRQMPMHCVNGALVFFYHLANELQTATQRYLSEELRKDMKPSNTSRISGGIRRLKNWLKMTFSKSITLPN